jgi:parallel beta-helix repeat protein
MKIMNLTFILLFPACLCIISCTKEQPTTTDHERIISEEKILILDVDVSHSMFNETIAANEERLKKAGVSSRSCLNTVTLPDDAASIQEAIDLVCPGGTIQVTSGTYNENVVIVKSDITITGSSEAQLNGSFTLNTGADNVTIEDFNIYVQGRPGIFAVGVQGGNVSNNSITGTPFQGLSRGIQYHTSSNIMIQDNEIYGLELGIGIVTGGLFGPGISSNNTIRNNTLTNMFVRGAIILQGNCDNNTVQNNTITDSPEQLFNAGITLINFGATTGETCDNNKIRQNNSSNNLRGIWISHFQGSNGGGNNNMIGPGNICNGNQFYGIQISEVNGNRIINNTALNNGQCDIIQEDGNNNFRSNTAICTDGF